MASKLAGAFLIAAAIAAYRREFRVAAVFVALCLAIA